MFHVFMEIMPRLRLFTLILAKILALTNKVLKYFFSYFFFLSPILQPSDYFNVLLCWIESLYKCWPEKPGIQIFCFICKTNRAGAFLTKTLWTPLTGFIFFPPENTYLQMNISCFFSLLSLSVLFKIC